jgi:LPXTG-motif cell wall-anchored protein
LNGDGAYNNGDPLPQNQAEQSANVLPDGLPAAPIPHENAARVGQIDDFSYIEFDENDIPLGVWTFDPGDPDDPSDDLWVFDEEIPLGMLEMPKTGETPLSALLMGFGLAALLAGLSIRKKAAR